MSSYISRWTDECQRDVGENPSVRQRFRHHLPSTMTQSDLFSFQTDPRTPDVFPSRSFVLRDRSSPSSLRRSWDSELTQPSGLGNERCKTASGVQCSSQRYCHLSRCTSCASGDHCDRHFIDVGVRTAIQGRMSHQWFSSGIESVTRVFSRGSAFAGQNNSLNF